MKIDTEKTAACILEMDGVGQDGQKASELDLAGKPAPDFFLEAPKRLGVKPGQAVVIEDALWPE